MFASFMGRCILQTINNSGMRLSPLDAFNSRLHMAMVDAEKASADASHERRARACWVGPSRGGLRSHLKSDVWVRTSPQVTTAPSSPSTPLTRRLQRISART